MGDPVMNPINGSGPVHIKRQGNVAVVYVDMVENKPIALSSFEDIPIDGFPVTLTLDEVNAAFKSRGIVWHEPPKRENPVAVDVLTPEQMEAEIARVTKNESPNTTSSAPPSIQPGIAPVPTPVMSGITDRILSQFKLLLAKYEAAEGKKKTLYKGEVESIANFILVVAPDMKDSLLAAKTEVMAPKFSLED